MSPWSCLCPEPLSDIKGQFDVCNQNTNLLTDRLLCCLLIHSHLCKHWSIKARILAKYKIGKRTVSFYNCSWTVCLAISMTGKWMCFSLFVSKMFELFCKSGLSCHSEVPNNLDGKWWFSKMTLSHVERMVQILEVGFGGVGTSNRYFTWQQFMLFYKSL